jgi:hypothetical protein
MKELKRQTVESILGKSPVRLSAEQSSEVDEKINEKMQEVVRESNRRLAQSDYDASQTYVW